MVFVYDKIVSHLDGIFSVPNLFPRNCLLVLEGILLTIIEINI